MITRMFATSSASVLRQARRARFPSLGAFLLALLFAVVVAGCGASGEGDTTDATPTPTGSDTPTPTDSDGQTPTATPSVYLPDADFYLHFSEVAGYSDWNRQILQYQPAFDASLNYGYFASPELSATPTSAEAAALIAQIEAVDFPALAARYPIDPGEDYYIAYYSQPDGAGSYTPYEVRFSDEDVPAELEALRVMIEALEIEHFPAPPGEDEYRLVYGVGGGIGGDSSTLEIDSTTGALTLTGDVYPATGSAVADDADLDQLLDVLISARYWQLDDDYPCDTNDFYGRSFDLQMGDYRHRSAYDGGCPFPDLARLASITAECEALIDTYFPPVP